MNGARGSPSAASFLFRGQAVHALFLTVLLPVAWGLAAPALGDGRWLGLADTTWFWIAVGEPVVHQLYVWIAWRAQLRWETFSGLFGRADFAVYGVVFYVLLALRPVLIAAISAADSGSLAVRFQGMFHPVGSDLTMAEAKRTRINAFGISYEGKTGLSKSPFSWAA